MLRLPKQCSRVVIASTTSLRGSESTAVASLSWRQASCSGGSVLCLLTTAFRRRVRILAVGRQRLPSRLLRPPKQRSRLQSVPCCSVARHSYQQSNVGRG